MFTQLRLARTLCFAGAILTISGGAIGLTSVTSFATSVGPGSTVSVNNTPFSSASQDCDESRDGWHFIMNQLEYPAGSTINGADFGPVNITFTDGSTAVASFTDLAGGKTAHFINTTDNQVGDFTIASATMTFPAGTDITGYGNFVISHPPCGTVTPTTTVAPTTTIAATTTVPATTVVPTTTIAATTTVPETTVAPTTTIADTTTTAATTTVPATTVAPTTTLVLSDAPTTTVAATTTLVASEAPVPTTIAAATPALPSTGSESGRIATLGLVLFGFGLTLMGLARRSRPVSS